MARILESITEYLQPLSVVWIAVRVFLQIGNRFFDRALVQQSLGKQKFGFVAAGVKPKYFFIFLHSLAVVLAMSVCSGEIVVELWCGWVGCHRFLEERNGCRVITKLSTCHSERRFHLQRKLRRR